MRLSSKKYQEGQVIITAVVFFLAISLIVIIGISSPIASQVRNGADFLQSRQSYIAADTLDEEAIYRLNKGKSLPSSIVLAFSQSTSTASITNISSSLIQVIATGVDGAFSRSAESTFTQGQGVSFNYGVQTGNGGLNMSGSAKISGNVYSNGNIVGSGSPSITGTAIASVGSTMSLDPQQNTATGTPAVSETFGDAYNDQALAQSFTVSTTTAVAEAQIYIKKTGAPSNATVYIVSNNGGSPSTNILATGSISASQVTTSYGWVTVPFSGGPSLTPGTTYWLMVYMPSNSTGNTYSWATTNTNSYSGGTQKIGQFWGSWTTTNSSYDSFFQIYEGGVSSITGVIVGSGGTGDANAFTVSNSTVSGNLYCQGGSGNNKSCNQSQPVPSPLAFPFSDNNITDWKTEAAAGGVYNGNINLGGVTATSTGPLKINGSLTVGASAVLTLTGPIYVTGDININGAAVVKLASSYGASSGVIVTDGRIYLSGSGGISGSGTSGSYVILATTSGCGGNGGGTTCAGGTDAINVSGAAGAVALMSPYGNTTFTGSGSAKASATYSMVINGGATLTYDSGLANMSFSSGPSGAWNVNSWQEIP